MPRNKISDLNDHLFAQLERLSDESLTGEALKQEIERGKAISEVAANIVGSAKVIVDAMKIVAKGQFEKELLPDIFKSKNLLDVK